MTRICLSMIVKDEVAIIERCLRAAAPFVDCYAILDTGSTDGTPAEIKRVMDELGVPGILGHGEFVNFEQARNDALALARRSKMRFHYILLVDADMEMQGAPVSLLNLTAPAYRMTQRTDDLSYGNVRLVRRGVEARYVGVTHEHLDVGGLAEDLAGVWFLDHACGSSRANKFQRDIDLLLPAHRADPTNARTLFYLAQSYRDNGDKMSAFHAYGDRVKLGGWDEEVWYSMLQLALLEDSSARYLAAYEYRPTRVEPLVELARHCRDHKRWAMGYMVASQACRIVRPDDVLFLDESAYSWRAHDELAIAAYWTGRHEESRDLSAHLLAGVALPESQRARVQTNLMYAEAATKP